jgi:cytidyltransferase-like protein
LTRAYCGGTFDLFHPGHVRFFCWVKENFDELVVGLNRDAFVARYKAPPAQSYGERLEMLLACRYVDYLVCNTGDEDSKPAIRSAPRPTHIVNGSDWSRDKLMRQMGLTESFLSENGLTVVLCPLDRIFSTTELKQRIKNA